MNINRSCDCTLTCVRAGNSRCVSQGKLAYHPECREKWLPCAHMALVSAQLDEYVAAVQKDGVAKVPDGCIPLIGYTKKKSTMLEIYGDGRNFLEEREIALATFKRNHNLKKVPSKKIKKACPAKPHVQKESGTDSPAKTNMKKGKTITEDFKVITPSLTLSQYFTLVQNIVANGREVLKFYFL